MKIKENLIKKLKIGTVCLAVGIGGFGLGKASSKVDYISFNQDQHWGISGYKSIRLHKHFDKDEVLIRKTGYYYLEA